MKIRPTEFSPKAPTPSARGARKEQEGAEDTVAFSKASRLLLTGSEADRFDAAKVASLRAALSNDTYRIDDIKLAKAILQKELSWT